jgi:anti-sigma regulatory factor (Ser/Thr protein kinase)
VLVYRRPSPLDLEFPAEASELAPVRHAVRAWLRHAGITPEQSIDVMIATAEACVNAVEHGHRNTDGGVVRLHATALAETLRVTITDNGSWKNPDPVATAEGHRGRGIMLMRGLMQDVTITPTSTGTTVDMLARITP